MTLSFKLSKTKMLVFVLILVSFLLAKDISFTTKTTLAILLLAAGLIPVSIELNKRLSCLYLLLLILLTPFLTAFLSQFIMDAPLHDFHRFLCGTLPVFILLLCIVVAINNIRFSAVISSTLWLAVTTINWFVFSFRGSELTFHDFFSLRTAANVAGNYSYSPSSAMVYAWCLFLVFLSSVLSVRSENKSFKNSRIIAGIGIILSGVYFFMGTSSITVERWKENGSVINGFILNFSLDIVRSHVSSPADYSLSEVDHIISAYRQPSLYVKEDSPDVIVIMNEAFADFSVYGDKYQADEDAWRFYHSLDENVIKGYALTSAFGGGTANSEYEFLTGNTMAFLPNGSVPYMQYVNNNTWSLVSYFNELGYETIGAHPYLSTGWKRNLVYPQLGFNDISFLEDFQQNDLLRGYVSDSELYHWVLNKLTCNQNKKFIFAVSMQNHSAYGLPGWEEYGSGNNFDFTYVDVNDYLSLQKITDAALQNLVESLKEIDSKTVLIVFGDHQPRLNDEFYNSLIDDDSLNSRQLRYQVPFLVWANYDIKSDTAAPLTSLNYLAEYLFETTGIPKPEYFQFLSDVREVIPAINRYGYCHQGDEAWTSFNAYIDEPEMLKKYRIIEYNSVFDEQKNKIFIRDCPLN